MQTNPSFVQREYGDGIISLSDSIAAIVWEWRAIDKKAKDLETLEGIISKGINQIN